MTASRISRRSLIVRGGATLGALLVGGLGVRHLRERRRLLIDQLVQPYLADPAALRLGNAYLRATPDEGGQRTLIAGLLPLTAGIQIDSAAGLIALIRTRIADEISQRSLVTVQGWQLSRTEARLFALAALRSDKAV